MVSNRCLIAARSQTRLEAISQTSWLACVVSERERATRTATQRSSEQDGPALMVSGLVVVWAGLRWHTIRQLHAERSEPEFEEEPGELILTLEVCDSRFSSNFESS
jgi:hypothetical protein